MSEREKWFYDGQLIETINAFTYVGLNFTCKLSLFQMAEQMVVKAKKVLITLLNNMHDLLPMSHVSYFKIFDAKVCPICYTALRYGAWKQVSVLKKCMHMHVNDL